MDRISSYKDLPADGLETPYGRLYPPQSQGAQIIALIAAFAASMSLGSLVAAIPGDLSTAAQVGFHIPYVLVFFVGYSLWVARINAVVFDVIGRSVLKALWQLIVHRKQPDARETVLPSREKLLEMLVKTQKAGASFRGISWPIAALSVPVGLLSESSMPAMQLVALLRVEFARAIEPLVRRGMPAAVAIAAEFRHEPNGEARTVAARAYARARIRTGSEVQELIEALRADLTGFLLGQEQRQQAAVAALLELGRADLVAMQREDGRPLQLSTYSNSRHNWEFIATVVEHWESLASAVPDIWERFDHSSIIATELAKAGKRTHALSQTQVFENAVRTGKQLEVEQVRALIALHGRSALLRDLFLGRLQFMAGQNSMRALERAAYAAMASYVADHFRADEAVGQVMLSVATSSSLIYDVGLIALCRGWPDGRRSPRLRRSCQHSLREPSQSPGGCLPPKQTPRLWRNIS